jgi:hypothetical protein
VNRRGPSITLEGNSGYTYPDRILVSDVAFAGDGAPLIGPIVQLCSYCIDSDLREG